MNAAEDLDDIIDQGLGALDLRWDEAAKGSHASAHAELPLEPSGIARVKISETRIALSETSESIAPPANELPTWDDVTPVESSGGEYFKEFEAGALAGARDVIDYRYSDMPSAGYFALIAYHQKYRELSGERLRKYMDGFVEAALRQARIRHRRARYGWRSFTGRSVPHVK
jgi:hypothetical protein